MGGLIAGVFVKPLKVISDDRGKVMHMLRNDAEFYSQFGEVYFSTINGSFIKGWKKHVRMTQHYAVPLGNIKLVLYDDRNNSKTYGITQEINVGENNYCLVRIPPGIWYAFRAEGKNGALIVNCTDIPHDPSESIKVDLDDGTVPYKWSV